MKVLTNLDLTGLEIQNVRAQNLAAAPGTPLAGRFYYDTATNKYEYWNGSNWISADGSDLPDGTITSAKIVNGAILNEDINTSAAIALTKLATDPLARANHTGTQLAATVSDFNTARDLQRLDQHAVPTAPVNLNNQKITNLGTPTLSADAVPKSYVDSAVDTAVVARKFTATVGDGAALFYVVTHSLGNQWVDVSVVRNSAPFDFVSADIELTSTNSVTVRFAVAPTVAAYRVIVTG